MKYYISDLHFGHKNVIRFDERPFTSKEEMDQALIDNWNSRVKKKDEVYIVGDVCYCANKPPEWYIEQLNGQKHLIIGNHDDVILKSEKAKGLFESIDQILRIRDDNRKIVLCHYPIAEWYGYYRDYWHIYGHVHRGRNSAIVDFMRNRDRALNAGCMINNYMPVTMDELIANNTYNWR